MPGESLDTRDFECLESAIAEGQAPQGVLGITGRAVIAGYYRSIALEIDTSAEIDQVKEWVIKSLAEVNGMEADYVRRRAIRFGPVKGFGGPVAVTFKASDPSDAELAEKIRGAYR